MSKWADFIGRIMIDNIVAQLLAYGLPLIFFVTATQGFVIGYGTVILSEIVRHDVFSGGDDPDG